MSVALRDCVRGRVKGGLQFHHVEEHEAGMRISIIGNQHLETVFFVKRNGGEISVNGKEAKGGTGSFRIQQVLYRPHQFAAHSRMVVVLGHGEAAYLDSRITTEMFAVREQLLYFTPRAV